LPQFGHLPVILGDDGQKLSKRRGAVAVSNYDEAGYLPEAMNNYLARLGWSHGDDELFSREQLVSWFDGTHLNKSPAQWDPAKLAWVNAQYLKQADDSRLAALVRQQLQRKGIAVPEGEAADAHLARACALFKDRCSTTVELADWLAMFFVPAVPSDADRAQHLTEAARAALAVLGQKLASVAWDAPAINATIKQTCAELGLKMPQLAIPVRVAVCGRAQTPSVDAVLALFSQEKIVALLQKA